MLERVVYPLARSPLEFVAGYRPLECPALPEVYLHVYMTNPDYIYWQHTSLEAGFHTSYPGHGGSPLPDDHRESEWYKQARETGDMAMRLTTTALVAVLVGAGLGGCGKSETPQQPKADGGAGQGDDATGLAPVKVALSLPQAETAAIEPEHLAKAQKLLNGGIAFLLTQREADGGWSLGGGAMKPAVTALVLKVLCQHDDFDRTSPVVRKGFEVVLRHRQKDGAIFDPKQGSPAYSTAIAIMAMAAAGDPQHGEAIRHATEYLKGIQIQPGQESPDGGAVGEDSPRVGGVGYGRNGEPNLSVLGFVMDAWQDGGVKPDDEAVQRAVGFLTRHQNRRDGARCRRSSQRHPWRCRREGRGPIRVSGDRGGRGGSA